MKLCSKCGHKNDVSLGQTACFCCGAELPEESLPDELERTVEASPQQIQKKQSHKGFNWNCVIQNRVIQRVFFALISPKVIYGLVGALIGIICAGLTDPSGYFSMGLNQDNSGNWRIGEDVHVSYTVFLVGAILGFCVGTGYQALRSYLKRRDQRAVEGDCITLKDTIVNAPSIIDKAGAEPKRVFPIVLFTLISIVFGCLCYKECTEHLSSMNDGKGYITCATILHHRELERLSEQMAGQEGELDRLSWRALGYEPALQRFLRGHWV
jgi:hypothetical protein